MESDCLFCKVVKGELPSYKVYEDEHTYAFLDIHPINRGHTLVVPKLHHKNLFDVPYEVFEHVMHTAHLLAPKIQQSTGSEGVNIGINNNEAAGQIVYHLHVHIIPRWKDDGHAQWHGNQYQDGEIGNMQEIIAQEFK